jgi:hypothetical protein
MKNVVSTIILMFSLSSLAQVEFPVLLKDGKIVTTLRNGKKFSFSSNEYMVVKRKAKVIEKKKEAKEKIVIMYKTVVEPKPNRIRVIGGVGPGGKFSESVNGNFVDVKNKTRSIGGVGYDRMLNKDVSVGGQALSNGTFGLSLGLDF